MTQDLRLPACCTLAQADALSRDLRDALSQPDNGLHIDASAVEEADVSLLQLLIATGHSCAAMGVALHLSPSPELAEVARRAGLQAGDAGLSLPP